MLQGKQIGPLTPEEVEARIDDGAVGPRTYLWRDGMDAWQRAKEIPELSDLFPQLPPPPTPSRPAATPEAKPSPTVEKKPEPAPQPAASRPADASSTPAPAMRPPPVVPRSAPMFGSAAAARTGGPFAIFVVLFALAVAGVVLFIVLYLSPPKQAAPPEPAPPAGLTAEQVRRKLDEHKPALQGCVDEALRRDPNLKVGQIHVATTIAPSGEVTEARIDRAAVDESPLGACLKRATKQILFPPFSGSAFAVDIPISVGHE